VKDSTLFECLVEDRQIVVAKILHTSMAQKDARLLPEDLSPLCESARLQGQSMCDGFELRTRDPCPTGLERIDDLRWHASLLGEPRLAPSLTEAAPPHDVAD